MELTVRAELVMAWRLATWPTMRSPFLEKATTEGVVRLPSEETMTVGSPPSIYATHELVVPKSMPMVLDMVFASGLDWFPLGTGFTVHPLCEPNINWPGRSQFVYCRFENSG